MRACIYIYIYIYTCAYACICFHMHACICRCICICICICMCMHVHAYAFICMHMHAYASICIHMHAYPCIRPAYRKTDPTLVGVGVRNSLPARVCTYIRVGQNYLNRLFLESEFRSLFYLCLTFRTPGGRWK